VTALPSLRQLRYLVTLADTLNFTRAAEACFVTQSTLSGGIQELERVLGATLVERDRQRVVLTPVGHDIVARARGLLSIAGDLVAVAAASGDPMAGLVRLGAIPGPTEAAEHRYRKAATKGVIKAISRMGISTVHSYHGAQVFEAIGLNRDFVDEYFTWTPTRIGGIGIEIVSKEVKARQDRAWPPGRPIVHEQLPPGGQYQFRADGENHLFNPLTVHTLQKAVRTGDYSTFKDYSSLVDDQSARLATLRGLLELRPALRPVPIDEVEPVEAIVRRRSVSVPRA